MRAAHGVRGECSPFLEPVDAGHRLFAAGRVDRCRPARISCRTWRTGVPMVRGLL